jgi:hypothetical protein
MCYSGWAPQTKRKEKGVTVVIQTSLATDT